MEKKRLIARNATKGSLVAFARIAIKGSLVAC